MIKRTGRYVFFVAVYLSGILIGGVFTPDVITYAKQMNAQQFEQPQLQQKPNLPKKQIPILSASASTVREIRSADARLAKF